MTECQSGMVEAQQVQQSRMQVMNVNLVFGRFKSEFIGRPMNVAAARAAAGQPHAESVMIVITAIDFSGVGARRWELDRGRAAKFAAPNYQSIFEHTALLEVGQQRADRLIAFARQA